VNIAITGIEHKLGSAREVLSANMTSRPSIRLVSLNAAIPHVDLFPVCSWSFADLLFRFATRLARTRPRRASLWKCRVVAQKTKHVLGRAPGPGGVKLNHASISSKHALVECISCGVRVTDLGSSNGTYVNRAMKLQPADPIILTHGMELSLVLPRSRKTMVLEDDVSYVVHDLSVINSSKQQLVRFGEIA